MRILVTGVTSMTHWLALAPTIRAAERAGHDVIAVGSMRIGAILEQIGLARVRHIALGRDWIVEALGQDFAHLTSLEDFRQHESKFFTMMAGTPAVMAARQLIEILGELRTSEGWWPDVVIREFMEFSGYLVACVFGIPLVTLSTGGVAGKEFPPSIIAAITTASRAAFGLAPSDGQDAYQFFVSFFPPGFDPLVERLIPNRHYYRNAERTDETEAELLDWPKEKLTARPIILSPSTTALGMDPRLKDMGLNLMRLLMHAVASIDCPVIMSSGAIESWRLGTPPANVRLLPWIPQGPLLRHSRLLIGQGGYNATEQAMATATPQLLLPMMGDAPRIAECAERAGVARVVQFSSVGALTANSIRQEILATLTSPSYKRAAERLRNHWLTLYTLDQMMLDIEMWVRRR